MTGNRMSDKIAMMPARQKVMAVITVVIVLIVLWMVIDMFRTPKQVSVPASQSMAKPAAMAATSPSDAQQPMGQSLPGGAQQGAQMQAMPQQAPQLMQTNVLTMSKDAELMKQQQQTQKDYLDKLNELQLLKVQREISETNQAISAARLATVTADKSMTDLLTKPAAPEVPASAYANSLSGSVKPGFPIANGGSAPTTPAAPTVAAPSYVVISVSMQFNRWSAVVGSGGKLYNVSVGDTLPPDGAVVLSISSRGIVLEKDGKKQIVNLISSI
jgi:hypothetical protein